MKIVLQHQFLVLCIFDIIGTRMYMIAIVKSLSLLRYRYGNGWHSQRNKNCNYVALMSHSVHFSCFCWKKRDCLSSFGSWIWGKNVVSFSVLFYKVCSRFPIFLTNGLILASFMHIAWEREIPDCFLSIGKWLLFCKNLEIKLFSVEIVKIFKV